MMQFETTAKDEDEEHGAISGRNVNDSNNFIDERIPLARLVNLSPSSSSSSSSSSSILPGPFVVLQGSPGDGMANTIDTMPVLPRDSGVTGAAAASAVGGISSRRNSAIQDRIPDRVLEELDSEVSDESGDGQESIIVEDDEDEHNNNNDSKPSARARRPRSNSETEGGLHLPLGASSSPIMRDAHRNMGIWNGYNSSPLKSSASGSAIAGSTLTEEEVAVAASLGLPLNDNVCTSVNDAPLLKRRPTDQEKSAEDIGGQEINNGHSDKTPPEIQAIHQWRKECSQQELSHLEEANQNVKLLIQQRKRTREQQEQRSRILETARSVSPAGTSTSASSSSTDSGSLASRQCTPAPSKEKEEKDPLVDILNALELAHTHRSWYQKDGRLVVFKSLPHMSLQGVVSHPIASASESASNLKSCDSDEHHITLAPGCTVMAEQAYILDSRTLRQLNPETLTTNPKLNAKDDSRGPQLTFLKITSPHNGYILSSIHSYPLLLPGLPTTYTNMSHWLWRVTCQPDGAYIRKGLELVTHHIGTLSYGMVGSVTKKVVNDMGLNRLKIEAYLEAKDGESEEVDAFGMIKYSGYISEFLNPLSGQRGNVVEPIPFPVPALYKVINAKGCIIRSGVELSTTEIGFAPAGSMLSIVGRSYSDNPSQNCIERLKLAGGGGWISVTLNKRPPGNELLVTMVGVDGSFNPNDPSAFHFESMRKVMDELHANSGSGNGNGNGNGNDDGANSLGRMNGSGRARATFRRLSSYADLSEIGDDDAMEQQQQQQSSSSMPANSEDNIAASFAGLHNISPTTAAVASAVPTLFRSGVVGDKPGGLVSMDAIRESSSDGHHHNSNPNRCLICLSDERTATIVHGETGHIACCLTCARILKARGDNCPVCRLPIDLVIQQFWA